MASVDWTAKVVIDGHMKIKVHVLQEMWNEGLATSEIGRRCSALFGESVTKNAVVGKAHRQDWESRPSPIRRDAEKPRPPATAKPLPPLPACTLPPLRSDSGPLVPVQAPRKPAGFLTEIVARQQLPPPDAPKMEPKLRCPGQPLRRRDGTGCLFPIGEPGKRDFRFCDADLADLAKPYCPSCAKRAYSSCRGRVEE